MKKRNVYVKSGGVSFEFDGDTIVGVNGEIILAEDGYTHATLAEKFGFAERLITQAAQSVNPNFNGRHGRHYGRYIGEIVYRHEDPYREEYRVVDLSPTDNNRCDIVHESLVHNCGEYPPADAHGYVCEYLRHAPRPNEVWRTRAGNLALIIEGPPQYFEVSMVKPPGAAYSPSVHAARTYDGMGLLMLYKGSDGVYTAAELRERLHGRTFLHPSEFFAGVTTDVCIP